MRTNFTINDIRTEMEALYRNITGRKNLTAVETDILLGSVVDAYSFVLLDYGVESFRFQRDDVELATVAGQEYVDLPKYAYKPVHGSLRIASEMLNLNLIDEVDLYSRDPDLSQIGVPSFYTYMTQDDIDTIRLRLWPIPDAVYTINATVLMYPEDSISSFPSFLMPALKFKAKSLACVGLGIAYAKLGFDSQYKDIMELVKVSHSNDVPKHIGRTFDYTAPESVEGRIP